MDKPNPTWQIPDLKDRRESPRREDDVLEWRVSALESAVKDQTRMLSEISGKLSVIASVQSAQESLARQVEACRAEHLNGDAKIWQRIGEVDAKGTESRNDLIRHEGKLTNIGYLCGAILLAIIGQAVAAWFSR